MEGFAFWVFDGTAVRLVAPDVETQLLPVSQLVCACLARSLFRFLSLSLSLSLSLIVLFSFFTTSTDMLILLSTFNYTSISVLTHQWPSERREAESHRSVFLEAP